MKDIDIAWAAGLFEGEGTFGFFNGTAKSVSIHMTDLDILERVKNLFGGSIIETKKQAEHHKNAWRWSLTGKRADFFVETILPYLGSRRTIRAHQWLDDRRSRFNKALELSKERVAKRTAIKEAYQTGGLTQQAIADRFGVDRSYVSHIMRGKLT